MRTKYELKNVKNVPLALKQRIYEDARAREITMADVVGEILSAHWSLPYALSGERNVREQRGNQLLIWLPPNMLRRIWSTAKEQSITESAVICVALADHYELPYTPVRRRGAVHKRKKEEEAAA